MKRAESNVVNLEDIKKKQEEKEQRIDKYTGPLNKKAYSEELRDKMRKETGYYE